MKAVYQRKPDCIACMDLGMDLGMEPANFCPKCMELNREVVDILQLGVGLFADKAVIKKTNGALATVPMSELTIID